MSISEIANTLVELCRQGKNMEAKQMLYSPDIVSVESTSSPTNPAEVYGIEAVTAKGKWFVENNDLHSAEINGPFIGESQFAVEFKYDLSRKQSGQRFMMHEMGLYTVAGDKIVREHFFYPTGG